MFYARIDGKVVEVKLENYGLRVFRLNRHVELLFIPYAKIEDLSRYKEFMTTGIKIITSNGDIYRFSTDRETSSTKVIEEIENKINSMNSPLSEETTDEHSKTKCENCGTENPKTAEFCIKCGNGFGKKVKTDICYKCGAENPPEAEFCQKCGENLSNKLTKPNKEYLEILKKQEKHGKDTKQGLFVIFIFIVIIPILIVIWLVFWAIAP